jgi:hypothetical protein
MFERAAGHFDHAESQARSFRGDQPPGSAERGSRRPPDRKRGQMLLLILDDPAPEQRGRWEALMASVAPFHRNVAASCASQAELEHEIDQTIEEVRSGRA